MICDVLNSTPSTEKKRRWSLFYVLSQIKTNNYRLAPVIPV
jgi:hypothetical protein